MRYDPIWTYIIVHYMKSIKQKSTINNTYLTVTISNFRITFYKNTKQINIIIILYTKKE